MVEKTATCRVGAKALLSKGVVVAIHQPNYIPWLGYFYKIAHADKFVFLDIVAYSVGSFVNRNYIKTPTGPSWLTIPVVKSGRSGQSIRNVETHDIRQWANKHLAALRTNYGRAPHFKEIFTLIEPHYCISGGNRLSLAEFNMGLIVSIVEYLGIRSQFLCTSDMDITGHKNDLILDICRTLGATTYLAGTGAMSYQNATEFEDAGIALLYSPFVQRNYPQLFGEFTVNLSIVDVLMNCGYVGTRQLLGV